MGGTKHCEWGNREKNIRAMKEKGKINPKQSDEKGTLTRKAQGGMHLTRRDDTKVETDRTT